MGKESRLTPIKIVSIVKSHEYWLYKCSCGNFKKVRKDNFDSGAVRSCGCLSKLKKNPLYQTKFYRCYHNMVQRCVNEKNPRYPGWGGRGVQVLWRSFKEFKLDMYESFLIHEKKHGGRNTTLDRIDNNGNYCRANCRWATSREQYDNRIR